MWIKLLKDFAGHKAGAKIEVDDPVALALVGNGTAEKVEGDPVGPLFEKSFQKWMDGLDSVIDKTMQTALASVQAKRIDPAALLATQLKGEDLKGGFDNLGAFATCVKAACAPGATPHQKLADWTRYVAEKAPTGLGEQSGADGGFLVPPQFSQKIMERLYSMDNVLGRTDQYTTGGNSMVFPRNAETSRANGSRWGGVRAYWREEGDQGTASKPTFGRLQLDLHKLFILCYATDELLADSGVALEQYLTRVASDEINFVTGDTVFNGTGAGQPAGIITANCTVSVAKETGQAAATIVKENIDKMYARMWAPCRNRAVWFINQDIEPQLESLAMNVGTGGVPVYLPPGGITDTPNARLKGRPVIPVEWCPTLGTVGDIILADLSHYVTLSKSGGISSAMSMHLRFDYDEMAFRFIFRVDGKPWWTTALTPYKGTNTQSCFITLATRS